MVWEYLFWLLLTTSNKYAGARTSNTVSIFNYLNYSIVVMYHNTTHHDFHLGRFFAVLGPTHYRIMYVRGFQIDDAWGAVGWYRGWPGNICRPEGCLWKNNKQQQRYLRPAFLWDLKKTVTVCFFFKFHESQQKWLTICKMRHL